MRGRQERRWFKGILAIREKKNRGDGRKDLSDTRPGDVIPSLSLLGVAG
jgi:hypothetical protein